MLDQIDDTIVAISSPPGRSAVGIVRLTGRDAIGIVERLTHTTESLARRPGSSQIAGSVCLAPDSTIPARFLVFRAPRSYTREDLVEIHTIGTPVVLEMIRREAIALGAMSAAPGAFTARALIHGAMDASQAEAVGKLIYAQTDAQLRAARGMMDGSLGRKINQTRDELAETLALVEADIDFAEEPIEFITPHDLRRRLTELRQGLTDLWRSAQSSERITPIPHILLLGPPNAGKSTLLNALTSTRRAICAAVSGTTRDLLSAPIRLGRGEAILLDSAGVDQSQDEILRQARALTLTAAQRVDLVCIVLDASTPPDVDFIAQTRVLELPAVVVAANKCDRLVKCATGFQPVDQCGTCECGTGFQPVDDCGTGFQPVDECGTCECGTGFQPVDECGTGFQPVDECGTGFQPVRNRASIGPNLAAALGITHADWPIYPISAIEQAGLDALRRAFADQIQSTPASIAAETLVLSERQRAGVDTAATALRNAIDLATDLDETIDRADLIAFELREALDALGTVTGAVTTEDMLTKIFANFCIGK